MPKLFKRTRNAFWQYLYRNGEHIPRIPLPDYTTCNSYKLLVGGHEILPAMLDMINGAKETIRWNVLLFRPDNAGKELADALCAAAGRGVRVQLAFDFAYTTGDTFRARLSPEKRGVLTLALQTLLDGFKEANIEVRNNRNKLYPSGDRKPDADEEAQHLYDDILQHVLFKWDHFDHRKVLIVDEQHVMVGGSNVGNEYLYHEEANLKQDMREEAEQREEAHLPEAWDKWVDAMVLVSGEVAAIAAHEFDVHWAVMGDNRMPERGAEYSAEASDDDIPIQPLYQNPGHGEIGTAYAQMIDKAMDTIYVASPYISYPPILQRLKAAAKRGVKVRLVYPNKHNDIQLSARLFHTHISDLLKAGIEIYENNLRMAHYKVMVVDGQHTLIGSFNLNYRSFKHDFEFNFAIDSKELAAEMIERVFTPMMEVSDKLREYPKKHRTPMEWILEPLT
jgi:cardiolipin synthase A/B